MKKILFFLTVILSCEGYTGKGNKACPISKITFQTFTSPHVSHTSLQSILPGKS